MTDDLQILKSALANGPTRGTWYQDSYSKVFSTETDQREDNDFFVCQVPVIAGDTGTVIGQTNQQYIAACSPDRIARLIQRVEDWKSEYENVCKFATDYEYQRDELRAALKTLYLEQVDYITRNHLGDPHHNQSMKVARSLVGENQASSAAKGDG